MKKRLALFLAFALLICAFSASIAETAEDLADVKAQELESMMDWLSTQISEEEAKDMLTWDQATILSKLEPYDQPLTAATKEEAAEQLYETLSLMNLFSEAANSDDDGEAMLSLLSGTVSEAFEGGFTVDWDDEDGWSYVVVDLFNGTFWQNGDKLLEAVFQDGYYKVVITEGDAELTYLCEYDEYEENDTWYPRLTSIGTGVSEWDAEQPDHGVATFIWDSEADTIIWTDAEGSQTVFTHLIDPLDGAQYFADEDLLTISWQGRNFYQINIERYTDFISWTYQCMLDEATDTMTGSGFKTQFGDEIDTNDEAVFTFQNGRSQLVWTSEKEESALNGLPFEGIEKNLTQAVWSAEDGAWLSCFWMSGYYNVQVFAADESIHGYLCTFDRDSNTLIAADPSSLDYEALNLYVDQEQYKSTGSFQLLDDDHLLWLDDAGAAGDGVLLTRDA